MSASRLPLLALGLAGILALAGCTDTVYRDRAPFNPPPDAASGFLGYYTASTQSTTCGNCHVGHQADWSKTAHANAYASLANLPFAAPATCYSCHTVTAKGNRVVDSLGPAGYDKVRSAAYQDVQCESCHGPGLDHLSVPDDPTKWPLARGTVDVTKADSACGACHNDTHHPFVEQWASSRHSQVITYAAANASCAGCHDGKKTLQRFGVYGQYVEKDSAGFFPVTCAVCHDPHGTSKDSAGNILAGQLRFPVGSADSTENLCMKCHLNRAVPLLPQTSTRSWTPHAPQGAVVIGDAGYLPTGYGIRTATTHASTTANPRLCAGCHVNAFTVNDTAGNFAFQSVGHDFQPIPCVDPTGLPIGNNNCGYTVPERNWGACTTCHGQDDGTVVSGLRLALIGRLDTLAMTLWIDVDGDEAIDAFPADSGYLAIVVANTPSAFTVDNIVTAAEGAEFNVKTAGPDVYDNGDKSEGVHNPFLLQDLLLASIGEIQTVYGPFPAPPAMVQRLMDQEIRAGRLTVPPAYEAFRQSQLRQVSKR